MSKVDAAVSQVSVSAFRIPTDAPEADGTLRWDATTMVVCEITAAGQTGLGYSYSDVAAAHLIAGVLAPLLEGSSSLDTGARWRDMVDAIRNLGRAGLSASAISACDTALHDLRAKILGVPLSKALGAVRDDVLLYGSGGFLSYSDARLTDQIAGWVDDGFGAIKIKVGSDPSVAQRRIGVAREAAGDEQRLMIDANGACTPKGALTIASIAADHCVTWFEEPVSSNDLVGLRSIRDRGPAGLEIAAGEYGYDAFHFRQLLEAGAVDVMQADATRCCGITGLLQADALAWAHNVPLSLHTAPALHREPARCCHALRDVEWFHDHARIEAMLFDGAPVPEQGMMSPEEGRTGLGLALKRTDALEWQIL
ncbi:enolase C-terminal domain-like protein [Loktanella sp. SALINAS62]|uniref:enolase C-terminal domain-like protein n=1 Tax=Loktanella sp. SALINAS62 TaxID=2706124 RepID=UPI001B8D1EE5|nr:enolase C-terminal domain-like protein [Loktanella sp. SALINAS62]MBS1304332.1 mandelate racemase [Loktanella sp. SALINAS62]